MIIGGVAVIIHGMPRITQDLDVLIEMMNSNLGKVKKALNSLFHDDSIDEIQLNDLAEYAVVRYGVPKDFHIDLIARVDEVAIFDSIGSELICIEGVDVNVAKPTALFELKKNTVQPEDKRDAFFLKSLLENKQSEVNGAG